METTRPARRNREHPGLGRFTLPLAGFTAEGSGRVTEDRLTPRQQDADTHGRGEVFNLTVVLPGFSITQQTCHANFIKISLPFRRMTGTQTRQFKLKMREPNTGKAETLRETLDRYNDCVNAWIKAIGDLNEEPNRGNVHDHAYHDIKNEFPQLYSNTIQECMNRAIEIMRNRTGSLPEYDADSMSFKAVDMRYDSDNVGIPVIGKTRVWVPIIVPSYFGEYRELEKGRCTIIKDGGRWYAAIAVEYPIEEQYEPDGFLGVDLGIRQIAVVSDADGSINEFYGGEILERGRELYARYHQLQERKSGENSLSQALRRVSGKESRFMDDVNHKIAAEIVELAKHHRYGIAVENLKGLRQGKASKKLRRMLHRWAYRDLCDKLEYKAEAEGIPLEYVDPRSTSKTCSRCGQENKVGSAKQYECNRCGVELNRDLNGARNVAMRGGDSSSA